MKQKINSKTIIPKRYDRILKIMKISALFFFLCTFCVLGENTYSQSNEVSLNLKNVAIKDAISEIEKETGYVFIFNEDVEIKLRDRVTIDAQNKTIEVVLAQLLKDTDLDYSIIAKQITIYVKNRRENVYVTTSTVPIKIEPQQQDKTVKGKVTDGLGEPLPGITIIVKGTSIGTTSDVDGGFVLSNIPNDAVLVFSFVGMRTQEIPVAGNRTINVVLEEEILSLDEVIVIGYGTARRQDYTGSVSSVKLEGSPVSLLPNLNPLESLKGNVSGLNIGATNTAGGQPSMLIRGQNSISGSNNPLIVLDGVIWMGSLSDINPNDIANYDILKDAVSAAAYGSRSANGVIAITTKKGKIGKPIITANVSTAFQT